MKKSKRLDVKTVLKQFEDSEKSSEKNRGTFKIDSSFEEAVKSIANAKPQPKKHQKG